MWLASPPPPAARAPVVGSSPSRSRAKKPTDPANPPPIHPTHPTNSLPPHSDVKGVLSACTILTLWAAAFYYCHFCVRLTATPAPVGAGAGSGSLDAPPSPWWVSLSAFAALTHLYMGLFVTAHDAMHGAVCGRRWRPLNDALGAAAITCYAFFSYAKLHEEHWRHHHWTGRTKVAAALGAAAEEGEVDGGEGAAAAAAAAARRAGARPSGGGGKKAAAKPQPRPQQPTAIDPPLLRYDPDYHAGDARLLPWFAAFMAHYSSPGQWLRLVAATVALMRLGAPYANLCVYMCASAVLAAFQLFYWGTYRPHRPDAAALRAHANRGDAAAAEMPWRRARSAPWPSAVLWVQAYFFNLHYEHHRWPYCPWWDLPRLRREAAAAGAVPGFGGEDGEERY